MLLIIKMYIVHITIASAKVASTWFYGRSVVRLLIFGFKFIITTDGTEQLVVGNFKKVVEPKFYVAKN